MISMNSKIKFRNDLAELWFPNTCYDTDMQQKFLDADDLINEFADSVAKDVMDKALVQKNSEET